MNDIFHATLQMYKSSSRGATNALIRNWILIPASLAAYFAFIQISGILAPSGFGGGLIAGLLNILLLAMVYSWLSDSVEGEKVPAKTLVRLDGPVFLALINTAFILFLFKFVVQMFAAGQPTIMVIVQLGLILICNALPEVVYQHRYDGLQAIKEAFEFSRDNCVEWFLPFIALLIPWIILAPVALLLEVAQMYEFFPITTLQLSIRYISMQLGLPSIVGFILTVVFFNWYMLFRGFLFKELNRGTRRQRIYRMKQEK